jgi:Zn-dependent M28 family amino/carboxypeptidase
MAFNVEMSTQMARPNPFGALAALMLAFTFVIPAGCAGQVGTDVRPTVATEVDSARVVSDLRILSSREMEGRGVGRQGGRDARAYIQRELAAAGVRPFGSDWFQEFRADIGAANVVGRVPGTTDPGRYIVVTAHYDHLGARDGVIYYGADDNASGSAALLELARIVAAAPLRHSVIFAALDAEEGGMIGASAFVANPPVPLDSIVLNINMDMVSRNVDREIYVAGSYHFPVLADHLRATAARSQLKVLLGHDQPIPTRGDDWTDQSDHFAFFNKGIPFAYFGVEDHPDYHSPTDTFENTDPGFFVAAVATVLDFLREMDEAPQIR